MAVGMVAEAGMEVGMEAEAGMAAGMPTGMEVGMEAEVQSLRASEGVAQRPEVRGPLEQPHPVGSFLGHFFHLRNRWRNGWWSAAGRPDRTADHIAGTKESYLMPTPGKSQAVPS